MAASTTSYKYAFALMPPADDRELELRYSWSSGGDHHLLMRMLEEGRVPLAWREANTPFSPMSISQAYQVAKSRGYSVPSRFLTDHAAVSFTEREAFQAAHSIVRGDPPSPYWSRALDQGAFEEAFRHFKASVCQLTGQFIVPDPLEDWKAPYLLDQLWIVLYPNRRIRLIALEIDGEGHLGSQNRERDKKRDVMLASRGYEVYRAAGWWCRIDPYRVICEFLSACNLLPNAQDYLVASHLRTIKDYRCDFCGNPLSRWDEDWIQEVEYQVQNLVLHRRCLEEMTETELFLGY